MFRILSPQLVVKRVINRAQYSTKNLNVVFFGSDSVSNPTLQLLYSDYLREDGLINKLEVVCTADKKEKHGSKMITTPVHHFCEKNDIPFTAIPRMEKHSLKEWQPPESILSKQYDLAVVASFGYFIPPHVIQCFKDGGINMHPSLLPKYRGPAPIHHALLNGDKETGISIITLNDKVIDSGQILFQKTVEIDPLFHFPQLASQLALEGAMAVMDTIYNIDTLKPIPQDESKSIMASKVTKDMSFVNFKEKTATEVLNMHRALNYDYPLRCQWGDKLLFLRSLLPVEKPEVSDKFLPKACNYEPGAVLYCKERKKLIIRCKDNWVYCDEVQIMPKSKSVVASVIGNSFIKGDQYFTEFKGY